MYLKPKWDLYLSFRWKVFAPLTSLFQTQETNYYLPYRKTFVNVDGGGQGVWEGSCCPLQTCHCLLQLCWNNNIYIYKKLHIGNKPYFQTSTKHPRSNQNSWCMGMLTLSPPKKYFIPRDISRGPPLLSPHRDHSSSAWGLGDGCPRTRADISYYLYGNRIAA